MHILKARFRLGFSCCNGIPVKVFIRYGHNLGRGIISTTSGPRLPFVDFFFFRYHSTIHGLRRIYLQTLSEIQSSLSALSA